MRASRGHAVEVEPDLSWVYDLVAPDDAVRGRALARHQALVAEMVRAQQQVNAVWARAGTIEPREPHLSAEMDQARADLSWHTRRSLPGLLGEFWSADALVRELHAPFAVLFLQWEANYPDEWRQPASHRWSPWGTKESVLRAFARREVPDSVLPQVRDLVVEALLRPYRCKDWMYARLIQHVADEDFLGRLGGLLDAEDPLIRLRAQFALHLAEHPGQGINRTTWRRWLAASAA